MSLCGTHAEMQKLEAESLLRRGVFTQEYPSWQALVNVAQSRAGEWMLVATKTPLHTDHQYHVQEGHILTWIEISEDGTSLGKCLDFEGGWKEHQFTREMIVKGSRNQRITDVFVGNRAVDERIGSVLRELTYIGSEDSSKEHEAMVEKIAALTGKPLYDTLPRFAKEIQRVFEARWKERKEMAQKEIDMLPRRKADLEECIAAYNHLLTTIVGT